MSLKASFVSKLIICFSTLQFAAIVPKATMGKELAMYCVFKQPLYKFVDRLIFADQVFEKIEGEWQPFCSGKNDKLEILDKSAKCSNERPIFTAQMIDKLETSKESLQSKCKKNSLPKNFIDTAKTHTNVVSHWDIELNICRYFDLLNSDYFETKKSPWKERTYLSGEEYKLSNPEYFKDVKRLKREKQFLLATQFFMVEETDYKYHQEILYDFQLGTVSYTNVTKPLNLSSNILLVEPSVGLGQSIRDVYGYPWEVINFRERRSYDCEKITLE